MHLSFEFFPPKTEAGLEKLLGVANRLEQYNPEYFSVTFGAGGSTRATTLNAVKHLLQSTNTAVCPHLSCIASTKSDLQSLLDEYASMGVKNIIALRGDAPSGSGIAASEFTYAADLVAWIRSEYKDLFQIHVAAYPEVHPESKSMRDEIKYFQHKCAQGADSAITQYFFNTDAYVNFKEQANVANTPIIPGIMPIQDLAGIKRFSNMCGAQVPQWLEKSLADLQGDAAATADFVCKFITKLCRSLLQSGAPGLHFYTLNKADLICSVLDAIQQTKTMHNACTQEDI